MKKQILVRSSLVGLCLLLVSVCNFLSLIPLSAGYCCGYIGVQKKLAANSKHHTENHSNQMGSRQKGIKKKSKSKSSSEGFNHE